MAYANRQEAGRQLAKALERFKGKNTVVLALPRGGIVLGAEVARALQVPLGLVLVRKIGHPAYPEYAIGAVAEGEPAVYNTGEMALLDKTWLAAAEASARELIESRRQLYYGTDYAPPVVAGKTAILVDDGIATGLTMKAAVQAVRTMGAKRIVVAAPVAAEDSIAALQTTADEAVILDNPQDFTGAISAHYLEFGQVDDDRVKALLWEVKNEQIAAQGDSL